MSNNQRIHNLHFPGTQVGYPLGKSHSLGLKWKQLYPIPRTASDSMVDEYNLTAYRMYSTYIYNRPASHPHCSLLIFIIHTSYSYFTSHLHPSLLKSSKPTFLRFWTCIRKTKNLPKSPYGQRQATFLRFWTCSRKTKSLHKSPHGQRHAILASCLLLSFFKKLAGSKSSSFSKTK